MARLIIMFRSGIGDGDDGAVYPLGCLVFVFLVAHSVSCAIWIVGKTFGVYYSLTSKGVQFATQCF